MDDDVCNAQYIKGRSIPTCDHQPTNKSNLLPPLLNYGVQSVLHFKKHTLTFISSAIAWYGERTYVDIPVMSGVVTGVSGGNTVDQ